MYTLNKLVALREILINELNDLPRDKSIIRSLEELLYQVDIAIGMLSKEEKTKLQEPQ